MLGQDGCCLGCPLLIPILNGPGQVPHQFFCREREKPSELNTDCCFQPPPPPAFTFLHRVSRVPAKIHLGLWGLECGYFRGTGRGNRAHFWAQGLGQAA